MKKSLSFLVVLAMTALVATACTRPARVDPLGSSNGSGSGSGGSGSGGGGSTTTTFAPMNLLTNGVTGYWMSRTVTAEFTTGGIMGAGPADPISGQTSTTITVPGMAGTVPTTFGAVAWLRLTTCPVGTFYQCPTPTYPAGFFARAHVEFNLRLDFPVADVDTAYVVWGTPHCPLHVYTIPKAQLSSTNFVHFDIPLGSFLYPSGPPAQPCGSPTTTGFQLNIERISPNATNGGFSIADVKWTAP